jgi:polyhydroxybutyrate depolymerase
MKVLIALIVLSCASAAALAQVGKLVHKEEKRKYLVYTPASYDKDASTGYPVVFNFHGGGMSMAE